MIYSYTIYDLSTGRFTGKYSSKRQDAIENNVDNGFGYVEGDYDIATQMVVDGMVVDIPTETLEAELNETALSMLRANRNELLASCDWTQTNDSPLSSAKRTEWATYRQALRDLPTNTIDPANPVWPTPPE